MSKEKKQDGRVNNGGAGRKQGRKKLSKNERKINVSVFVAGKHVSKRGGLKEVKKLILSILEVD